MRIIRLMAATLLAASPAMAQSYNDPFPRPIPATEGAIRVDIEEFASLPFVDDEPPRMMTLVDEPGVGSIFVSDMRGIIYAVSYDGEKVTPYLDLRTPNWGIGLETRGRERGIQSFAFHPQFTQVGARGYGKLYTLVDSNNTTPTADFPSPGDGDTHHTILLEWTLRNPRSGIYDGGPPRELMRFRQPFTNHNGGHMAFNPTAAPGTPDYGMLYFTNGDGGSGGDPLDLSQNLGSGFGKVLRIDPLGTNSANGKYGIPGDNPFVGRAGALPEIYAYGVRNGQRFAWDPLNGNLFLADVGQLVVEELTLVPRGANLGWNRWEGSFRFLGGDTVSLENPRSDPDVTYPVVEYGQLDPLFQPASAATGVHVFRDAAIPQLENLILFGDMPSAEVLYISADNLPDGGQDAIRRVLFNHGGQAKTLLQLIQEKNTEQRREPATRADMRFGMGPNRQLFFLNKYDGVVRRVVP